MTDHPQWTVEKINEQWVVSCGENTDQGPANQAWFMGPDAEQMAKRYASFMNGTMSISWKSPVKG